MKFIEEFKYDMDHTQPRVILKDNLCIIENVKAVVMIGEESMTVETGKRYVTIEGTNFLIKEIAEGRLLVEGQIQGIKLLYTHDKNKSGRIQIR